MAFLIERDYLLAIAEDDLDVVTFCENEGMTKEQLLEETEAGVLKEISSFISGRYDVAKIFFPTVEHQAGDTYTTGTFLFDTTSGKFYTALVDTQAGDLLTDLTKFEPGEKRDALMKRHVINIALYELHSRVNPRYIPEMRVQRRDDSIEWLKMVQNPRNNVSADFLPMIEHAKQTGNDISWKSRDKQQNDY